MQSSHYSNGKKYDCDKRLKFLYWPKDVDNSLKHEIKFITESNESLSDNKIKNEIEQLLSKYRHGNDIHEHGKQQSKSTT